jgi:hypothetical protein
LNVPFTTLDDSATLEQTLEAVRRELRTHPGPTLIVMDRWVWGGDPFNMREENLARPAIDALTSTPEYQVLRRDGLVYAVYFDPTPSAEGQPR